MTAKSPHEIHALFCQYMRDGDIDSLLTLYAPDVVFCNRLGELKKGKESLRQELAPFAATKTEFQFHIRRQIESGDIALIHNEWTISSPRPQSGYAVEVVQRQPDGGWRFLIGDPFTVGNRAAPGTDTT